jgi:ankyrin repeat protein
MRRIHALDENLPYALNNIIFEYIASLPLREQIANYSEFPELFQDVQDLEKCLILATVLDKKNLVKLFLDKGATNMGDALESAINFDNTEMIELLLHYNILESDILEALQFSINTDKLHIASYIIYNGRVSPDMLNYILDLESESIDINIIQFLLSHGANPNYGLIGAARSGDMELVTFFIREGATNLEQAIESAYSVEDEDMIEFIQSLQNIID